MNDLEKDLNLSPAFKELLNKTVKIIERNTKRLDDFSIAQIELKLFLKEKKIIKQLLRTKPKNCDSFVFLYDYLRNNYNYKMSEKELTGILNSCFYFNQKTRWMLSFFVLSFFSFFLFILSNHLKFINLAEIFLIFFYFLLFLV